jgi:signal transduction histidine kinase/FixJ family two-component response regulator
MRQPELRAVLPWLIGVSLLASLICVGLAVHLGLAAHAGAIQAATREMSAQSDTLARQIEGDVALFDIALHEAANAVPRDTGPPKAAFPEQPLTARYLGFMNVLNEVGDVVADSRSNVSRPVNFAGRDYFQDHLKNPADTLMIGRPFATAPNQHASIPLSRRLNRPDGSFAGVVVAGVHLTWLSDLLSHPLPGPPSAVTVRRDDGVVLMRTPPDADAIGRGGEADPAWQTFLRDGLSPPANDATGITLFRGLGARSLVLELSLGADEIGPAQGPWLLSPPLLTLVPAVGVLGLSLLAYFLLRHGDRIEAGTLAANDEHMRLLANMSHELRSPLTGILGQAELMMEEGGLGERQATRLTRLTEAGMLMRSIINRVIDVARPEGRLEAPILAPCDLDQVTHSCLGVVEGEARRKNLRLTSTIDPTTPRKVMLARDLVQQVLINLLMNAVKFTDEGSVNLRITGDAARLWFEVADTGPGIPARKRRRLFREYDRLDLPTARAESTGLGLSITEYFVRRMGGRIGSIERKGGGSIFWVELPSSEPDPSILAAAGKGLPAPVLVSRNLRILLADDLDLTRGVTADYLRSAGHTVVEVPDGEAAVAEVQKQHFDVVLTDMRMPVVDGLEVTRRIRALPGHLGSTPVVLVTADLVALELGASGQTGVDVCLRKPFTRAELLAAVATGARLTPVPDADAASNPVLDEADLADFRRSVGQVAFEGHLEAAAGRIMDLLGLLESPDAAEDPTVRGAVHDLIGVSGLLGLAALSSCLRRFDLARERSAPAAALRDAAAEALAGLRRKREPAGYE